MFKRKEASEGKGIETNRTVVLASIMLAIFMEAIEVSVVATAIPSIVGELGGFSLFSWVFSAFLLAQAVTIPIYGKLADLYGRKPVFTFGVFIFLLGSILCGLAQTMEMLILFRFIQGFGAGAVLPIATTIIGDIYSIKERAGVQGYISSVWGVSSVFGPAIGAFLVQYVSWSWIFWVNVPIGVASVIGIWFFLGENVPKNAHKIDYIGSMLIFVSISSIMVVFIQVGSNWAWSSTPVILLLGLFVAGLVLFVLQEQHAAEPIMPLEIWNNSLIVVSNFATLTAGVVLIGISSFLPIYIQGVMNESPLVAGLSLAFTSVGWVISASIAGKLMFKYGFKRILIFGGFWVVLGSIFLVTVNAHRGWIWAGVGTLFVGIGMGLATTIFIVGIQNSVEWKLRGVATASNMFMNILGSTMGAALFGGVLNSKLISYIHSVSEEGLNVNVINILLDPVKRATLSPKELGIMTTGLESSLQYVFWGVFIFAGFTLLLLLFYPTKAGNSFKSNG